MRQFRMLNCEYRLASAAIFIVALALALLVVPVPSNGQQPAKAYRIGFLLARAPTGPETARLLEAFAEGLRERGYIEGQNLVIERRFTEGRDERAPARFQVPIRWLLPFG
jgi:putative tryptophan/tyrosine transport system substrate-binding protein